MLMCTAVSFLAGDHYFGRTLDLEISYEENIAVTPRHFPFSFRMAGRLEKHPAMIGMAHKIGDLPLYYEATNEWGLSMAALNFPISAKYHKPRSDKDNIAPFELIFWVLGKCKNCLEAKELLEKTNVVDLSFSKELPTTPLHWLVADENSSLTVESVDSGLQIFQNPVGVLTNNPPFEEMCFFLNRHLSLSSKEPIPRFADNMPLKANSRGMGALGLPGDFSSPSRFVKAAFLLHNSRCGESESQRVSQFFHILGGVELPRGSVVLTKGDEEQEMITRYTSCCNTKKGIYYYKTYDNSQITGVSMKKEDLDGAAVIFYPLMEEQKILMQNE